MHRYFRVVCARCGATHKPKAGASGHHPLPDCRRSGSFRASRSVGGSRGNVAPPPAPLNQSLSAHPLLPLPPGSDGTYTPPLPPTYYSPVLTQFCTSLLI